VQTLRGAQYLTKRAVLVYVYVCGEGVGRGFFYFRLISVKEMAGVVLETLSNRKLIAFGIILLLVQIGFFLIGGIIGEFVGVVTVCSSG